MDTLTIIIGGGIILVAIIVAMILGNRRGWRAIPKVEVPIEVDKPIKHYTRMRDKLTLADAGVEEDEEDESSSVDGGTFMSLAVAVIGIGVVLMVGYLVLSQVKAAMPVEAINATAAGGAQSTVFGGFALVAFGIIVLAAFGMISMFKD